ncbi:MAG: ribonuclease III domain-containing protein [Bacillota bacterium]|nr:ribonuclease III domain-containing protein [Bacillota bacterium]
MSVKVEQLNVLSLAYMGDAVWEQFVRARVIDKLPDANHADYLHKKGVKYVNAGAQAKIVKMLIKEEILTEEEVALVKRSRNHKTATKAKNADAITYKWATAFESLLGYLYLSKDTKRLNEIMKISTQYIEVGED